MAFAEQALDEPWRVVCPKGHTNVEPTREPGRAYCCTCKHHYDHEDLTDRKELDDDAADPR